MLVLVTINYVYLKKHSYCKRIVSSDLLINARLFGVLDLNEN